MSCRLAFQLCGRSLCCSTAGLLAAHGPYTAAGAADVVGLPVPCVSKDFSSFDGLITALGVALSSGRSCGSRRRLALCELPAGLINFGCRTLCCSTTGLLAVGTTQLLVQPRRLHCLCYAKDLCSLYGLVTMPAESLGGVTGDCAIASHNSWRCRCSTQ